MTPMAFWSYDGDHLPRGGIDTFPRVGTEPAREPGRGPTIEPHQGLTKKEHRMDAARLDHEAAGHP
jgi:hypothetical protein